ncbi:DgyrCDS2031 [Dimorphilus gyrociliatus]|uniref:DgyrCDS2031 n=1 Tax=Dimorphilus gyrociliatus TaxID=2664684 RepID=A0A7I8VE50_9ANNE|nr:DgyrCDS2031 [Dimorphilus gyrociliatus]
MLEKKIRDTKGQWLLEHVCNELNLVEKAYFGLRYVDNNKQRHWLDPLKPVYRQLKNVTPQVLCFRVKFYPAEPLKLKEEITRYYLFLQLRRDLHHGRLLCSSQDANLLAAYIVQSELGDYEPQDHPPGYVSQLKMLPKQNEQQEERIAELHKTLAGQVPSVAEDNFLQKASTLDTYGIDPHPVKDQKGTQMYIGVTHRGIITFQGNKRIHLFKWQQITKVVFEGRMFIIHIAVSEGDEFTRDFKRVSKKKTIYQKFKQTKAKQITKIDIYKKQACGFKCPTLAACKHLWKCAMEQKYFFTLISSTEAPKVISSGGFFSRGSKFRYSGRCQKEVFEDSEKINREPPEFERSSSNPQFVRSINHQRSSTMPARLNESFGGVTNDQIKALDTQVKTFFQRNDIQYQEKSTPVELVQAEIVDNDEEPVEEEEILDIAESTTQTDKFLFETPKIVIEDEKVVYERPDVTMNTFSDSGSEDNIVHSTANDELAHGSPVRVAVDEKEIEREMELAKMSSEAPEVEEEEFEKFEEESPQVEIVGEFKAEDYSKSGNSITPQPPVTTERKTSLAKTCCLASAMAFVTAIIIVLILIFMVLEPGVPDWPGIKQVRTWPEVKKFQSSSYEPVRLQVVEAVESLMHKLRKS